MNQNTASGVSFDTCLKTISNLYKYGFKEVRVNSSLQDDRVLCSVDQNGDVDFDVVEANAKSLAELQEYIRSKLDRPPGNASDDLADGILEHINEHGAPQIE